MTLRAFLLMLGLVVGVRPSGALSLEPPTFDQLVTSADTIVRGEVLAVSSTWHQDASGRYILTTVWVRVERPLVGAAPAELALEFLGGVVGSSRMEIPGMPQFRVGDRDVLFVQKNGRQVCPLVAFGHGRYRIVEGGSSSAEARVARSNGVPLETVEEVALPLAGGAVSELQARLKGEALSLRAFEEQIVQRARELGRTDVPVGSPEVR